MANEKYALIVEDNPDDALLAKMAFKRAQIANPLFLVSDGVEALDFIFCLRQYANREPRDNPAFILLDLKLPLINGIQVLEQIRTNINTRDIPVVVLTSSLEPQDQSACRLLGVSDYLQKPNDLNEFVDIIRQFKARWLN